MATLISRLFGKMRDDGTTLRPLYVQIVALARDPFWYRDGGIPDTMDGRFDMVATILSLALIRLEQEETSKGQTALLTEVFITDMDGQLREMGIGDLVVGKYIGKMMSALGGRLGAYREALEGRGDFEEAIVRNLWWGETPPPGKATLVTDRLRTIHTAFADMPIADMLAGRQITL